ncbi:MAG: PilZ domain-containing protein [bacterium]
MNVREAYERVLEEHQGEIAGSGQLAGSEQRQHPRFKVDSPDLWLSTVPEFAVADLSASGIAVISNHPVEAGTLLNLSLGKSLSLDTEVVACTMEYAPDEYTDGQFRIQCRFLEDVKGMELLVTVLQTN